MKRLILTCLAVVCALTASADEKSSALLSKMAAQIKAWKQYEVVFSLQADPSADAVAGSYTVSGQRYGLRAGDREVYCDGTTRWEVNLTDREVMVDKVNPQDKGVLSNPTQVFDFPDRLFSHSYGGQATWHGRKCDRITLKTKEQGSPIASVDLYLDASTGLPAGIAYALEGVSQAVEIAVVKIGPLAPAAAAPAVSYDKARYKGYEVIDFR